LAVGGLAGVGGVFEEVGEVVEVRAVGVDKPDVGEAVGG